MMGILAYYNEVKKYQEISMEYIMLINLIKLYDKDVQYKKYIVY